MKLEPPTLGSWGVLNLLVFWF